MATKIAHAVGDENGKARGGKAGDQTGKEILVTNWYNRTGGWGVYLECTDATLAKAASDIATRIANDDSFGYDQDQRSTAYKSILAAGSIESASASELDCSVLVFIAYKLAGLDIEIGYTGNLESRFLATGLFVAHRESKYLTSGDYATIGGIYLTSGKHTAIVVSNGSKSNLTDTSATDETDGSDVGSEPSVPASDVKAPYVLVLGNKVNIRNGSGTEFDDIGDAYKGDKYPYQGTDSSGKKWYMIEFEDMTAFISPLPNLTKLVLADGAVVNEEAEVDPPYVEIKGKVNVRFPAGLGGDIIYTAKNERLPFEEFDADTGWYGVMSPMGAGFVSNAIPRYAKLVKE